MNYDDITTIDDTKFPLAHGQMLGNFSGLIDEDIIYQLGEGNFSDAIRQIRIRYSEEKMLSIFEKLKPIVDRLMAVNAWGIESGEPLKSGMIL